MATTKQMLEFELKVMRPIYAIAIDTGDTEVRDLILARADEIKDKLKKLCYQCQEEPWQYNEYYCSKACNDQYFHSFKRVEGRKMTKEHLQQGMLDLAKRAQENRYDQAKK